MRGERRGGGRTQNRLVLVLGIVALVLAVTAFVGPWWVYHYELSHQGVVIDGSTAGFGILGETFTDQNRTGTRTATQNYLDPSSTRSVFLAGAGLTTLGAVFGEGMSVYAAMADPNPKLRRLGVVLGIVAFALTLAAPLYVMGQLPGALNEDLGTLPTHATGFRGSQSSSLPSLTYTISFGAGWAWYALLAAAVLFLIGGVALWRAKMPSDLQSAPAEPKR